MMNKICAFTNFIDKIKLPFRKEKEFYLSLYRILGFYPHDIELYKHALIHSSVKKKDKNGRSENNERLEFLGDGILDAVVGDIVYQHFQGKREGFLTNTRAKLVQRATLGQLAEKLEINKLIVAANSGNSHNSYMGGNAFEALVGAAYLDRGYDAVMHFMQNKILGKYIDLDKMARKEINFKSKLLEWTQKNRVKLEYELVKQTADEKDSSPIFEYKVLVEGVECGRGKGYSKKESQQNACQQAMQLLRRQPKHVDKIFAAKSDRTKMEEMPYDEVIPDITVDNNPIIDNPEDAGENRQSNLENRQSTTDNQQSKSNYRNKGNSRRSRREEEDEFDLSDINYKKKTKEEIIAEAEAAAFANK